MNIALNKNFIHEFDYKNLYEIKKKSIRLNSSFKLLKIRNCQSVKSLVENSIQGGEIGSVIKQTSHLFVICVELFQDINAINEEDLNLLQTLTDDERPLVIQLNAIASNNQSLIFYKDDNEMNLRQVISSNIQSITWEDFYLRMNSDESSKFEVLLQALASIWFGRFSGNLLECELSKNIDRKMMLKFEKSSSLCIRIIEMFNHDEPEIVLNSDDVFLCLKYPGAGRLLAILDFPFNVNDEKYTPEKEITINKVTHLNTFLLDASIHKDNPQAVKYIVKCFIFDDLNLSVYCNIAFKTKGYKAFVELIEAGARYPKDYNFDLINDSIAKVKLNRIISERQEFHNNIASGTMEKVKDYVKTSSNLKTVFNTVNKSALTIALESNRFQIFSFLQSKGFSKEGDAHFSIIWNQLSTEQLAEIRDANKEFFPEVGTHLVALLSKSRLSIGSFEGDNDYFKIIRMMYEELNTIEEVQPILKVIALSEQLNVVFDFNQTSVKEMDPTKTEYVRGTSYHNLGYIYVAVKNHENEFNDIIGTLVHEMTHYAMNLVYDNGCKPYHVNDNEDMKKYQDILRKTRQINFSMLARNQSEPIINNVFGYAESLWEAELIVRVPHLLARYKKIDQATKFFKITFEGLFNFYSCKVFDDLKNREENEKHKLLITEINQSDSLLDLIKYENNNFKRKFEVEFCQENEMNIVSSNVPIMTLTTVYKSLEENNRSLDRSRNIYLRVESIVSNERLKEKIEIAFDSVLKPKVIIDCTSKFKVYSEQLTKFIENLKFKNRFVAFCSTKEIYAFRRESSSLTKMKIQTFNHSWEEIEEIYRDKLMNSASINFQSHLVILRELLEKDSEAMIEIPLSNLLSRKEIKVDEQQHNIDFVNRKFLVKTRKRTSSSFAIEIDLEPRPSTSKQQNFPIEHETKTINRKRKLEENETYIHEEYEFLEKSLDEMIIYGNEKRVVLISDKAGTGKTFVLNEISKVLKERNKTHWVSFIDLKLYVKSLEKADVNVTFDQFVASTFYGIKASFDQKLFLHLHRQGKSILFLDGFDEISPTYKDTLIQVLRTFNNSKSGNQLWITTRTHLEQNLEECLHQLSCELLPFTYDEQIDYLNDFWTPANEKVSYETEIMARSLIKKFASLSSDNNLLVGVPLILSMLRRVFKDKGLDSIDSQTVNVYKIYEKFIQLLIEEWEKKGELANKDREEVNISDMNISKIHENIAIKHFFDPKKIRIDVSYDKKVWNMNKLCRIGIYKFKNKVGSFLHETFAEFLVARCIYISLKSKGIDSIRKGVKLLTEILLPQKYKIVRTFLEQALESSKPNKLQSKILTNNLSKALKIHFETTESQDLLFNLFDEQCENLLCFLSKVLSQIGGEMMKKWFSFEKRYPGEFHASLNLMQHVAISGNERMISIFFELLNVMDSVDQHRFLVELNQEGYNIFHFSLKNMENKNALATVLENMKRILDKDEMKTLIQQIDSNQNNMFHLICKFKHESSIVEVSKIVIDYLTKEQIKSMIFARNKNSSTCFMEALVSYNKEVFVTFCEFLSGMLSKEEMNTLLIQCDSDQNNLFHLICRLGNDYLIEEIPKLIAEFLTKEQTINMIFAKNKNSSTCFLQSLIYGNIVVISVFSKLPSNILSKEEMNMLMHQCDSGENNMFHFISQFNQKSSIEVFFKLVTEFLTEEQINNMVLAKNKNGSTSFMEAFACRNEEVFVTFCKFLTETLSKEEMKKLLQQRDSDQNNLIHIVCKHFHELSVEEFFKLFTEYLTPLQIKSMIFENNGLDSTSTCILEALAICNKKSFSTFRKFLTETLNREEMNKLLQQCDSNQNNIFHLIYKPEFKPDYLIEESKEEVSKLSTEYLTNEQIKSMMLAKNKDCNNWVQIAINRGISAKSISDNILTLKLTNEEIKGLLFDNNNEGKNLILSTIHHSNKCDVENLFQVLDNTLKVEGKKMMIRFDGENVFHTAASNLHNQIISTLWQFLNTSSFKEEIKKLLMQTSANNEYNIFEIIDSRNIRAMIEVFAIIKDCFTYEEAKKFLSFRSIHGKSCLHEACSRSNSYYVKSMMENIGEILKPEDHKTLIEFCDNLGNNIFLCAAGNQCNDRIISTLWLFLNTLFKEEAKKLLMQTSAVNEYNIFGILAGLSNAEAMKEVFAIIKDCFTYDEIKTFLTFRSSQGKSCLHEACSRSDSDYVESLMENILDILKPADQKTLIEFFDNDGNNVFHCAVHDNPYEIVYTLYQNLQNITSIDLSQLLEQKNLIQLNPLQYLFTIRDDRYLEELFNAFNYEEMKKLLQIETELNLFQIAAISNRNANIFESFYKILSEELSFSTDEVKSMLLAVDKNGKNAFQLAVEFNTEEVCQEIWKIIRKNFTLVEQSQLINSVGSENIEIACEIIKILDKEEEIENIMQVVEHFFKLV